MVLVWSVLGRSHRYSCWIPGIEVFSFFRLVSEAATCRRQAAVAGQYRVGPGKIKSRDLVAIGITAPGSLEIWKYREGVRVASLDLRLPLSE